MMNTGVDGHGRGFSRFFTSQRFLLIAILCGVAWNYVAQPIFVGDTDLWYHLNAGRFITENGKLPASSYFSFLEPARPFIDYYWLFQYLVYKVHDFGGYGALMVLRGLLYAAYIFIASRFFRGEPHDRGISGYSLSAFLMLSMVLIAGGRFINLRPHCFSYLIALTFIYVMEKRGSIVWTLPLLALLWVNFHGITYPVLLVICLSYLGSLALKRLREGALPRDDIRAAIALSLSMCAIWVNPNGAGLIKVPFRFTQFSHEYINELAQRPLEDYFNLRFDHLFPQGNTLFSLFFAAAAAALILRLYRRKLSPAHLLLFVGGIIFLIKGVRFAVEFSILTLPLAALLPGEILPGNRRRIGAPAAILVALLLAAPLYADASRVPPHRWPFPSSMLPVGTTEFLNKYGEGGKVFNHPNGGGYLQWALYPKFKIFMDMEIPFMFEDEDIFAVNVARTDDAAFDRIIAKYHPEYVILTLGDTSLLDRLEKRPEYAPIFFDDSTALYASRTLRPDLVGKFELRETRPVGKQDKSFRALSEGRNKAALKEELRRILALYPECGLANRWLAQAAFDDGDYESSLSYCEKFQADYPDSSFVHVVKGDALRKLGRNDESLKEFNEGLALADEGEIPLLMKGMAYTYKAMGDAEKAYKAFSEGVKAMDPNATTDEVWQYAMSAYLSGRAGEGVELARFAEFKVKRDEEELGKTIRAFLDKVEAARIQSADR